MLEFLMLRRFRRKAAKELVEFAAKQEAFRANVAQRPGDIMADSFELVQTTLSPRTFFGRCDDIAAVEERVMGCPSEFAADVELLTWLQTEFIDRLVAAGRYRALHEYMLPYIDRLTEEALEHYQSVTAPEE